MQTHINDDAICNLATTINNAFELVKSNQLVCFTRVLQDEYMNVKQYMYSIEQVVIVYEYLMLDDALAQTFFGMYEEFVRFGGINSLLLSNATFKVLKW